MPLAALGALALHGRLVRRWAPHAAAVAAGALLGGALFQLLPEAYARNPHGPVVAGTAVAGVIAFALLERLLHGTHDHHDEGHAFGGRTLVRLAVTGDAVHNLVDGALIAATFLADVRAGVLTTAAVALHEVPREFGTFGAIVHGGVTARRAVAYNAATALAAALGAGVTLTFGERAAELAPAVLPFAAGNFLYLAGVLLRAVAAGPGGWIQRTALVGVGVVVTGGAALV